MEDPGLQEIRDACADLSRPEDEPSDDEDEAPTEKPVGRAELIRRRARRDQHLPSNWKSKVEEKKKKMESEKKHNNAGAMIDFGDLDDKGIFQHKKVRVKVCGRYIWNYASQNAMTRKGWLHFVNNRERWKEVGGDGALPQLERIH